MRAVTSSVAALEALEHLPLDVLRGYQEKAAKLTQLLVTAEQSQTFTEENRTALAQFFEEVAALFQPTTYGHFCHMYPHFNFTIDLLTRIEAENRKNANLPAIPLDQIRKAILTENNRINLPSQGTEDMPLIITPIQKILAEAVHLGIVNENDPRYVAVQADLAKSKAR